MADATLNRAPGPTSPIISGGQRLLTNVSWVWAGTAVGFIAGVFLPPLIVRKLGPEGYGIWSLVFSFVGYYALLDLGFRSAVVRFTADYHSRGEWENLNAVYSTMLVYFLSIGVLLVFASFGLARYAERFFHVSEAYRQEFSTVVLLAGLGMSLAVPLAVVTGLIEGLQRFELSSQVAMATLAVRFVGVYCLLQLGYGLTVMAWWVLASIVLCCGLYFCSLKRLSPHLHFSWEGVRWSVFRQILRYGVHTFAAGVAGRFIDNTPLVVIGHYYPAAFSGYYGFPLRLVNYAADPLSRAAAAVAPRATEMTGQRRLLDVAELGAYSNRYFFALYMPFALFLLFYGSELVGAWMGTEFGAYAAPLIPVLLVGVAFSVAGQSGSAAILFGIARHQRYARGQIVEAAALIVTFVVVVPRYGLWSAAAVSSALMVAIRGVYTAWLVCRSLDVSLLAYVRSIYLRPLLTAIPVAGAMGLWKEWFCPGRNWTELLLSASVVTVLYLGTAYWTCLEPSHRTLLSRWVRRPLLLSMNHSA